MKVKTRNLCEIVLHAVMVLLLFIPDFVKERHWQYGSSITYHGRSTLNFSFSCSVAEATFSGINILTGVLGVLFIISLMLGVFFTIKQFMSDGEKANQKRVAIISIVELFLFVVFSIVSLTNSNDSAAWYIDYIPGVTFYFFAIIAIAGTALTVLGFRKANQMGVISESYIKPGTPNQSIVDEIKKYKDLLESGAITQEEYDVKKKQLLDL